MGLTDGGLATSMHELVRASALTNFGALVEELGGSPAALLRAVQLAGARPDDPDSFIPLPSLSELLELTARKLDRPDFGLLLASRQRVEILGPLALIARHSASALAAVHDLAYFMPSYAPALKFDLTDIGDGLSRYHLWIQIPMARSAQLLELGMGISYSNFKLVAGSDFRPVDVAFPHAAQADRAVYRAYFGCPVRLEADFCGFDLRTDELRRPRPNTDRELRRIIARYLEDTTSNTEDGLVPQVRLLISRMLPVGQASWQNVSTHLGYSGRTLQRRLAAEGTSFEALLDEVRRERAQHYLSNTTLSFGEIAAMLGYSQQSCFARSAKRWFGTSPREFRRSGAATA
ncbi:putative transcriptional regulatory protein [Mycobacterium simiae]|nr:putative transcriptional regulatory protein [Mycobacterium simiae]